MIVIIFFINFSVWPCQIAGNFALSLCGYYGKVDYVTLFLTAMALNSLFT